MVLSPAVLFIFRVWERDCRVLTESPRIGRGCAILPTIGDFRDWSVAWLPILNRSVEQLAEPDLWVDALATWVGFMRIDRTDSSRRHDIVRRPERGLRRPDRCRRPLLRLVPHRHQVVTVSFASVCNPRNWTGVQNIAGIPLYPGRYRLDRCFYYRTSCSALPTIPYPRAPQTRVRAGVNYPLADRRGWRKGSDIKCFVMAAGSDSICPGGPACVHQFSGGVQDSHKIAPDQKAFNASGRWVLP
jgi:hypothetical protein